MFNRIDNRTLNIASSFLHSNETSNHYATLHHCFSATLLTSFSFSLQLLFNMNLLTVGVGLYSDNWTELNWSETNMLLDHIFRGLDYNTWRYKFLFSWQRDKLNLWCLREVRAGWCSQIHHLYLKNKNKTWSPDAVKDISILEYPKQFVVCGNLVEVCSLFVCKEQVGFPNGVQHWGIQVQRVIWILLICQSRVIPLLSQKYIEPVVLRYEMMP